MRSKLGLSQEEFWSKLGVNQNSGSRYENGRKMPKPVKELLRLVHVEQIDLSRLKQEDIATVNYLKDVYPDLYKTLKKAAKSGNAVD